MHVTVYLVYITNILYVILYNYIFIKITQKYLASNKIPHNVMLYFQVYMGNIRTLEQNTGSDQILLRCFTAPTTSSPGRYMQ